MPNIIRGNVLYHSVAYNAFRNEYLVVFDVDQNNDNKADRVYGLRVNSQGLILDRQIIDFTLGGISSKPNTLLSTKTQIKPSFHMVVTIVAKSFWTM